MNGVPIKNHLITSVTRAAGCALVIVACVAFGGGGPVAAAYQVAQSAPAQVIVSGFSEPGDPIDNGVSSVYFSNWEKVSATTTGIYLSNRTHAGFVTYSFAPVAGQRFTVGTYNNVQRAEFRTSGFPGLEVTGPHRPDGCTRLLGSFRIWDVAADARGDITRLDLTYVEYCDGGRPANYGEVMINDAPRLGNLVASAYRIAFPDQTPTLPYVLNNLTSADQAVHLSQSTTTVSHFHITPTNPGCATTVRADSSCTYLVRLLPPKPGIYTSTVFVSSGRSVIRLALSGQAP